MGALPSQKGLEDPIFVRREDGSWLIVGLLAIAAFVMHLLGRIPRANDYFEGLDFRFEVVDMDGRRVAKVLVELLPKKK